MSVLIVPEDPPRSKTGRAQDTRWAEFVSDLEPGTLPFHAQWTEYQRIFRNRPNGDGPPLAWTPSSSIIAAANLTSSKRAWERDRTPSCTSGAFAGYLTTSVMRWIDSASVLRVCTMSSHQHGQGTSSAGLAGRPGEVTGVVAQDMHRRVD